jgi:hypothetical protein
MSGLGLELFDADKTASSGHRIRRPGLERQGRRTGEREGSADAFGRCVTGQEQWDGGRYFDLRKRDLA